MSITDLTAEQGLAAEADVLISGLMSEPWGQVSSSVYETGRLVTLTPWLTGHAQRLGFLVETQRPDGGWGAPDRGYALVPTLSATEALISALRRGTSGNGEETAADRGLRVLFRWLSDRDALTGAELPDMPAIELILPSLIHMINSHLDDPPAGLLVWRGRRLPLPAGLDGAKLTGIRALVASGGEIPEKLLHALEVVGDVARGLAVVKPALTGTIGASPAATAAWLGAEEPADPSSPARWHLETAVARRGGPVPCGLPITVFERAWVLNWLVRAGVGVGVPAELVLSLTAPLGPLGTPAAAGLPADADTTAGALYALALVGAPHPPDILWPYETDTHFCTWQGEQGHSITTNAHVLEAFGQYVRARPDTAARYAPAIHKVSAWLRQQQQADGSWLDRWHVSPYYATACAAMALDHFGGEGSVDAVRRAREWLLATQRPDGSWGVWRGTAEETAYAVLTLLRPDGRPDAWPDVWRRAACEDAAARGCDRLRHSPPKPDDPPLWHDKDLYLPIAIVRAAVLSALHLGERHRLVSGG